MVIFPDWPAPANVRAATTTRVGGVSEAPYQGLNLGAHVGDDLALVNANRGNLQSHLQLANAPQWLNQIHSTVVVDLETPLVEIPDADGSYTQRKGLACTVMTADCLPVILCDRAGTQVAAVHAGWRGLVDGIIEEAIARFSGDKSDILAWMGPAIGPTAFEVGGEVRAQFIAVDAAAQQAFKPVADNPDDKWLADLYMLATQRLNRAGVNQVFGGQYCTFSDSEQFYSYRRDGVTGRQATLIWLE
ncbi:peptidoglycan editing factor PgeF [Photobacterium sanctipauli]|uniref:Purine nucleoside phosphorylase n=1 Tax=Photobacterium sanctipauli TaxID=1342794 RepID=A0A2T3N8E5_9GAMM|nr:peptidoglycan editing factor PgeF [Photobacterium sanctipauli]PSW09567.1 peptidoglycan editing factor PgeF [Photobacterium sanctipauli]